MVVNVSLLFISRYFILIISYILSININILCYILSIKINFFILVFFYHNYTATCAMALLEWCYGKINIVFITSTPHRSGENAMNE